MHILVKNKKLYFGNYKIKCAIGKRGISKNKREGDNSTPSGTYGFKSIYYRKDRIKNIKTKLKKICIKKNMGWCDDSKSKFYNKKIEFPFKYNAEKLYKRSNVYDLIIVINYNMRMTKKNKGSAIFLHIANRKYNSTQGCIAVSKKNIKIIASLINNRSKIKII
jgi:L,D-peptidoglycan transpeptidase YkuD (ErfK/YbiS/YcfS/YnhG family)